MAITRFCEDCCKRLDESGHPRWCDECRNGRVARSGLDAAAILGAGPHRGVEAAQQIDPTWRTRELSPSMGGAASEEAAPIEPAVSSEAMMGGLMHLVGMLGSGASFATVIENAGPAILPLLPALAKIAREWEQKRKAKVEPTPAATALAIEEPAPLSVAHRLAHERVDAVFSQYTLAADLVRTAVATGMPVAQVDGKFASRCWSAAGELSKLCLTDLEHALEALDVECRRDPGHK